MDIAVITDIVVIAILLISAGVALFRGLIKELLTVLGIFGGLAMGFFFGDNFVPMAESLLGVVPGAEPKKLFDIVPYDLIAQVIAYAGVVLAFVIILNIISHFLSKAVSSAGLGPVDRTLGLIFGILRGVLLLGVLYLPAHLMAPEEKKTEWFKDSNMIFYLEGTSGWLATFLPQGTTKDVETTRELLENMDVLKSKDEEPSKDEIKNQYDIDDGYDKDERNGLDQLIGKEIDDKIGTYNQ